MSWLRAAVDAATDSKATRKFFLVMLFMFFPHHRSMDHQLGSVAKNNTLATSGEPDTAPSVGHFFLRRNPRRMATVPPSSVKAPKPRPGSISGADTQRRSPRQLRLSALS